MKITKFFIFISANIPNPSVEKTKVSYTTIQRAVEKLESLKIVRELSGGKRNKVY